MLFLIYGTLRRAANLPARSDTEGSLSHMQPILLILLGLAAGTLSGMLGIGGGIIIVPALHQLFKVPMNQAVGTSLLIIIPTAITGSITHYMKGNLNVGLALLVMVGAVAGGYLGARLASVMPELWLRRAFALLLLYVAFNMLFKH
ncbi:MAG: sulfite exporter TauE/SafE family protein [Limnochordales bacterium]|nr:permease [Bacillota bacterium]